MTETPKKTATKAAPATKNLAEALAQFQAELPTVTLDGKNPHFNSKFATLANISTIVLPKLSAVGLAYSCESEVREDGTMVFVAALLHGATGETRRAEYKVTDTVPQKIGSAETYFRRYGLAKLTGIVADGDDDGNAASAPEPRNLSNARAQVQQKKAVEKADPNAVDEGLKVKIREWMGQNEGRRKAVMDAQDEGGLKRPPLTGKALQEFMISKLGIE